MTVSRIAGWLPRDCPYCAAQIRRKTRICPRCHTLIPDSRPPDSMALVRTAVQRGRAAVRDYLAESWERECTDVQRAAVKRLLEKNRRLLLRTRPDGSLELAGCRKGEYRRYTVDPSGEERLLETQRFSRWRSWFAAPISVGFIALLFSPAYSSRWPFLLPLGVVLIVVAAKIDKSTEDFVPDRATWKTIGNGGGGE